MMIFDLLRKTLTIAAILLFVGCSGIETDPNTEYPDPLRRRKIKGKLFGEGGLTLFDTTADRDATATPSIGVNLFLWRATLDTISFMPVKNADPFGGTVLTEWYSPPETPNERFKLNIYILDQDLQTSSLRVSAFKEQKDASGLWTSSNSVATLQTDIENAILTRARQLKLKAATAN